MEKFASQGLTVGELNEIVERLGGEEGAKKFLRDETMVVSKLQKPFEIEMGLKRSLGCDRTAVLKIVDEWLSENENLSEVSGVYLKEGCTAIFLVDR